MARRDRRAAGAAAAGGVGGSGPVQSRWIHGLYGWVRRRPAAVGSGWSRRFIAQVADGIDFSGRVVVAPGGGHVAYQSDAGVTFLDVRAGRGGATVVRAPGSTGLPGSWDPDGVRFALPTADTVTIFDAPSGDVVGQGQPSGSEVTGIDFSTDGSRLAITDASGVLLVDPVTLRPVGSRVRLEDVPCAVSIGPDNHTAIVVTGVPKTDWQFWRVPCTGWALVDLESGSVLDRGTADGGIGLVDVSPAGRRAALEVSRSELLVLNLQTGRPLRPPVAIHGPAASLRYSPDGTQILTSGFDASASVWDAETSQLVARVVTPDLFSVSEFHADGHSVLIAASWEGGVFRWDTRLEHAIDFACRLAGRDLTETEWAEQFGNRPYRETCPS